MKKQSHSQLHIAAGLLALSCILPLASCAQTNDSAKGDISYGYYAETEAAYDADYVTDAGLAESSKVYASNTNTATRNELANRKLIKTVSLQLETREFDTFIEQLNQAITASTGYVESSSIRNSGTNRYATVTARIHADHLDAFCTDIAALANVTWQSEETSDVTLAYYDTESRLRALRSEYDTLIGILEKCDVLTDVISVQSRITEVLYEIESYQSQLNNYDSLVTYSTVELTVSEVKRETVVDPQTVGSRIADGFSRTMAEITEGAEDRFVSFVSNLPYIFLWALAILAFILILRALIRRWNKKTDRNS